MEELKLQPELKLTEEKKKELIDKFKYELPILSDDIVISIGERWARENKDVNNFMGLCFYVRDIDECISDSAEAKARASEGYKPKGVTTIRHLTIGEQFYDEKNFSGKWIDGKYIIDGKPVVTYEEGKAVINGVAFTSSELFSIMNEFPTRELNVTEEALK